MIVINIALVILGILYGVGSVTNFKEWYYRHDYLAIILSVFTSILLIVAGVLNILYWWKIYNGVFTTNKDLIALEVTSIVNNNNNRCADWRCLNVIELTAKHRVLRKTIKIVLIVKWVKLSKSTETNSPLHIASIV